MSNPAIDEELRIELLRRRLRVTEDEILLRLGVTKETALRNAKEALRKACESNGWIVEPY